MLLNNQQTKQPQPVCTHALAVFSLLHPDAVQVGAGYHGHRSFSDFVDGTATAGGPEMWALALVKKVLRSWKSRSQLPTHEQFCWGLLHATDRRIAKFQ